VLYFFILCAHVHGHGAQPQLAAGHFVAPVSARRREIRQKDHCQFVGVASGSHRRLAHHSAQRTHDGKSDPHFAIERSSRRLFAVGI
jgi:hypothetical protein